VRFSRTGLFVNTRFRSKTSEAKASDRQVVSRDLKNEELRLI
jgi:hypothetical protein